MCLNANQMAAAQPIAKEGVKAATKSVETTVKVAKASAEAAKLGVKAAAAGTQAAANVTKAASVLGTANKSASFGGAAAVSPIDTAAKASKMNSGLATAAFGLAAAGQILGAMGEQDQAVAQVKAIAASNKARNDAFNNRQELMRLEVRSSVDRIEREASKASSTLQVTRGEGLAGATYNALINDYKRNELNLKERVVSRNTQAAVAMRESLVTQYQRDSAKAEQIEGSMPGILEVGIGLAITAVSTFATFGVMPFAGALASNVALGFTQSLVDQQKYKQNIIEEGA